MTPVFNYWVWGDIWIQWAISLSRDDTHDIR